MTDARRERGGRARRRGRRVEVFCALWLMAKGYRLLGFRLKTPFGEIDILARKRGVLVAIEVKQRTTLQAALEAVSHRQRAGLMRAVVSIAAKTPQLSLAPIRLDLMALAPGRLPRHIRDAWRDE